MELLLALVVLVALAWFVGTPLLRSRDEPSLEAAENPVIADLEARKEALYRQIRDAELDRAQGKLSEADWRRLDSELRRDAINVLKELDAARE